MSGQYLSADVYACLAAGHRFTIIGSDKTPLKKILICQTCTDRTPSQTIMVAHGQDVGSWGDWRKPRKENNK
jgi:hypothetical protein